jgi:hypothetical protein
MSRASSGSGGGPRRSIIFEFFQIGHSVKVTAVDEATGLEVSIVGPATGMRSDLETVARAKLMRALERSTAQSKPK